MSMVKKNVNYCFVILKHNMRYKPLGFGFCPKSWSNQAPPIITVKIVLSPCGKEQVSYITPRIGTLLSVEGTRKPKAGSFIKWVP